MQPKATPPPPPPRRVKPPASAQESSNAQGDASPDPTFPSETAVPNKRVEEQPAEDVRKLSASSVPSSPLGNDSPLSSRSVKFVPDDESGTSNRRAESSDVQDMHGFLLKGTDEFLSSYAGWQKNYSKKQSERGARWSDIIKRSPAAYDKSSALKKLVRKGIPNYLRGRVWMEVMLSYCDCRLLLAAPGARQTCNYNGSDAHAAGYRGLAAAAVTSRHVPEATGHGARGGARPRAGLPCRCRGRTHRRPAQDNANSRARARRRRRSRTRCPRSSSTCTGPSPTTRASTTRRPRRVAMSGARRGAGRGSGGAEMGRKRTRRERRGING